MTADHDTPDIETEIHTKASELFYSIPGYKTLPEMVLLTLKQAIMLGMIMGQTMEIEVEEVGAGEWTQASGGRCIEWLTAV